MCVKERSNRTTVGFLIGLLRRGNRVYAASLPPAESRFSKTTSIRSRAHIYIVVLYTYNVCELAVKRKMNGKTVFTRAFGNRRDRTRVVLVTGAFM